MGREVSQPEKDNRSKCKLSKFRLAPSRTILVPLGFFFFVLGPGSLGKFRFGPGLPVVGSDGGQLGPG